MTHKLLIGTDEAGYGPNLGPLVISATSWQLPVETDCSALWAHFNDVLTDQPVPNDPRLFVADSKQVYSPAAGLVDLETGVLSFLGSLGLQPANPRELGRLLAGDRFDADLDAEPHASSDGCCLPVAAFPDEIQDFQASLRKAFDETGIRLTGVCSRIIFPTEFNKLVAAADSKGVILSQCTMQLVRQLCPADSDDDDNLHAIQVYCDKHGGRNRYDELICDTFGDQFVFRMEESTAISRYRMGKTDFCFRTKAEEFLPVALASMISKYLREVLMIPFNEFWKSHVPNLKPTKGYPLDAKRFRSEIEDTARSLGIAEDRFWRIR